MERVIKKPLVIGLGKVGYLVALLLKETGFKVTGCDLQPDRTHEFPTKSVDVTDLEQTHALLAEHDCVISCLPYNFNAPLAQIAAERQLHYFDLTEDVETTNKIIEISKTSKKVMAPQCGLAPGFIAIVGATLASRFEKIRSIKLRVGALPKHPTGLLGYAFNWSPEGVVNEYLNDCEVIEHGTRKMVSPLEWLETLVIDGVQLEAFTTSGGLGTMCETYAGVVENLDYKSIRYPGHAALMNFYLHELLMREDRELAGKILVHAKPPVNEDVVYMHASAEGWINGNLQREEFVRTYEPVDVAGRPRRTIAWTTAASVCSVVELVAEGRLPNSGFIKQEEIGLEDFLATANGRLFAGQVHGGINVRSA
ncbi:MAG: L-lysine dehydrogenase [Desulfobulbaceae bacterium]|nr:MAG: L-lysine dehydrogenase [Desulfobulbaceae bacterium]